MFGIDAMRPTDPLRRLRSPSIGFLRGFRLALAVVATVWLTAPTTSRAYVGPPVTDFVFSNASAVLNGTPVSVSGRFAVGGGEWFAGINVTGNSPYAGGYSWDLPYDILNPNPPFLSGSDLVAASDGDNVLHISVGNDLSLASVSITSGGTTVTGSAPTGGVVVTGHSIDYSFSNASTVLNGVSEAITGGFTFDPLTDIEYMAQLGFNNSGGYGFDAEYLGGGAVMESGSPQGLIQIGFANNLSFAADPLEYVQVVDGAPGFDPAPTGFAVPDGVPVPAPAIGSDPIVIALIGGIFGLFLLSPIWRAGQPHADRPEGA